MMFIKHVQIVLVLALLTSFVSAVETAAPAESNQPAAAKAPYGGLEDITLPPQDTAEYWVIRSQAVNDLTSFLTQKRAELKEKLAYFADYITLIGKTDDLLASTIEVTDDPAIRAMALGITDKLESKDITLPKKPLTWNELVEFSMKYIQSEGYSPVYLVDEEELTSFKNILSRNEQFCQKVRTETLGVVNKIIKSWLYLGTIEKQKDFRLYMLEQKKIKEQSREEKRRAILDTQAEAARQRRETQKQNVFQERQSRLQNQYNQGGYYY